MRLPPVLSMSLALSAWVSSEGQRRAESLPPANTGDGRPDPGNRPRAPSNASAFTSNGAGGYVLPDGTAGAGDGSGGFQLPTARSSFPTGPVKLPNGTTRWTSDGARLSVSMIRDPKRSPWARLGASY